jgi:hypothetical protein
MKLIKLTQWIDKTKTQPILINAELIQSIEIAKHDDPVPIIGEKSRTELTHIIFKGGTQGRLVTESFEKVLIALGQYSFPNI